MPATAVFARSDVIRHQAFMVVTRSVTAVARSRASRREVGAGRGRRDDARIRRDEARARRRTLLADPSGGRLTRALGDERPRLALRLRPLLSPAEHRHPNDGCARLHGSASTTNRALVFLEANAHRQITVDDVAAAAFVTPRAVQLAFRSRLGRTPMQYLRDVRLARAHDDLLRCVPGDGETVGGLAERWRFSSASRFSARYLARYGEAPGQALRRVRAQPPSGSS